MLFNLAFGEQTSGIEMVGALPQQLPPLSMPQFSLETFRQLSPLALAMTLFALTEAVSIARSISLKSGQPIAGNQEFIGQGLSNIFGSFFSSYVATGSFNRSGANYDAGARSPLAADTGRRVTDRTRIAGGTIDFLPAQSGRGRVIVSGCLASDQFRTDP